MSQDDYVISDQSGASFLADINNILLAIVSNNSGATEPTTKYAYQWWADTTTGKLKQRNSANSSWIEIGTLATANLGHALVAGSASQAFSVANATAAAHAVTALQYQNNALRYVGTSGTSTAYVVTMPIVSAYTDGMTIDLQPHVSCGSSPTLNINGVISLNIKKVTTDGSLINLAANDLIQYRNATITYSAAAGYFVLRDARAIPTAGTTGQVLTSQGAGAAPTWSTLAGFVTETTSAVTPLATGALSASHSLGQVPTFALMELTCITGDAGYTAGDVAEAPGIWSGTAGHISQIWKTASQVGIYVNTGTIVLPHKSTGTATTLTNANWSYRFKLIK